MSAAFTESLVETAAVGWLKAIGWRAAHGPDIGPDMPAAERANYGEVVLGARLRDALARLNPTLPAEALEDAYRKLTRLEGADLIQRNRALHRLLVNGVTVEYRTREGEVGTPTAVRSTLLPKVTSDELRVKGAELFVEKVQA